MKIIFIVTSFIILGSDLTFAESETAACNPKAYAELVKCVEQTSAEIAISDQQLKAANELESFARQWANPDFDFEKLSKGSEKSETTASLLFNLRLGGKRSAEIGQAQAEREKAKAVRDLNVGQARLSTILALYRLSHLKAEIALEEESGTTFSKIVQQFQRKPALSPEERVSLSVFKIATADHKLSLNKLKNEQEALVSNVSILSSVPKDVILKLLPVSKVNWPDLKTTDEQLASPSLKIAAADLKIAENQKVKAEGDSWPDLKVGPVFKVQEDNGNSETFSGVGLSMPLPVFTLNGGGRSYANQKLTEAQMSYNLEKKKSQNLRSQLALKYKSTVSLLQTSLTVKELDDRHEAIEKEFFRGLVSGALVIEAHRQLFEFVEKRNQSELEAIDSLGQIMIYDNQFDGVVL